MTENPAGCEHAPRRVFVWCLHCHCLISRESLHRCTLPARYRAARDAQRRQIHTELDALIRPS